MPKLTLEELLKFRQVVVEVCEDPNDPLAYHACVLSIIDHLLELIQE